MSERYGKLANNKKAIYQLSLSGEILAYYDTVREASKSDPKILPSLISRVLAGNCNTHAGYKWKYATDVEC